MKTRIVILMSIVMLVACNQKTDKRAELDKLMKERNELNDKITALQKEISSENGQKQKKITDITVKEITPQAFNHYIEVQGKVDGEENVTVTSKTIGVVTQIYVKEGTMVRKGQILASLDASVLKSTLDDLESTLVFVKDLYDKQKSLWDQKIGSEVQYLTAKNNKESLENKILTMKEQIRMSSVVSPISGSVEEVGIKIGQSMAPGIPAFRVVNFSRVKIMAEVAEAYSQKVKKGVPVLISFPDINKEVETKLEFSSKFINPTNRTFTVEARLSGKEAEFRANMIAVLKINDYVNPQAIVIPVNLLQKSGEGQFVYVVKDEKGKKIARKQIVTVGLIYNGLAEITDGLKTGDKVIMTGYNDLYEGNEVKY
ncbi:MAG: efflux RND transporter periplasmic adaptor subunit [Bacteroidota bacterium]